MQKNRMQFITRRKLVIRNRSRNVRDDDGLKDITTYIINRLENIKTKSHDEERSRRHKRYPNTSFVEEKHNNRNEKHNG